jgi:hypothetical protein
VGGILGAFLGPPGVAAGGLATYLLGSVLGRKQGQRSEQAKREEHDRTWDEAEKRVRRDALQPARGGGVIAGYMIGGPLDGQVIALPRDAAIFAAERSGDQPLQWVHLYRRSTRGLRVETFEYRKAVRREDFARTEEAAP